VEYYRIGGTGDPLYVRIKHSDVSAEYFDEYAHAWLRLDAYYDQIVFKGDGVGVTEVEALAATTRVAVA
jgi:hypothetical protein